MEGCHANTVMLGIDATWTCVSLGFQSTPALISICALIHKCVEHCCFVTCGRHML